jgi:hypothetical protein
MRSSGLFAALSIAAAVAIGCGSSGDGHGDGSSGGLVSCTVSESAGTIALKVCEEADNTPQNVMGLKQACMVPAGGGGLPDAGVTAGADFEYAGCSHVGALGACRVTTGGMTVTGWYYQDPNGLETSADIQTLCAQSGATYVAP